MWVVALVELLTSMIWSDIYRTKLPVLGEGGVEDEGDDGTGADQQILVQQSQVGDLGQAHAAHK